MLKYLKRVDHTDYSIHKIFKSFDVREVLSLKYIISGYAEGFKGQNVDYSEDVDRLEIDIIKTLQGGCKKRELKCRFGGCTARSACRAACSPRHWRAKPVGNSVQTSWSACASCISNTIVSVRLGPGRCPGRRNCWPI